MSCPSGKSRGRAGRPAAGRAGWQPILRPLALAGVVVLAAALLANSMTKEIGRDEQMYCTAGVLLSQGKLIYRDFSYPSQLPCHPLLLAALYRALGTTHYLLVGRLVSVTCDALAVVLILLIYRRVFGTYRLEGLLFGLAAGVLYVFNPAVDYAAGYAWNHDVVILCVIVALWLFVTADLGQRTCFWRIGLMGAVLTVATCMRVTTALVELLFLVALLLAAPGPLRERSRTALPFSLAALAVALWPLWVILQAPRAFWLNLVRIPALYGRWLHEINMVPGKIALTVASLLTPGYLALLILAGGLIWVMARSRAALEVPEKRKAGLAALLPLLFLAIAYIPPTMWPQYLAVPVPFLVIGFAYPLAAARRRAENPAGRSLYRIASVSVGVAVVVSIPANLAVLQRSLFVLVPERWTPVELHKVSVDIAARVQEPQLALTLGPLHALEGGCDIYPELASGSIVYRVADLMSPQERQATHTVGRETLAELVEQRPPSAVMVGVEPPHFSFLEEPLRRAASPDWPRETYGATLQVYRRPRDSR